MPQHDGPRPKHFLELHRSFRFVAPDPARILPGFLLAAALSGGIAYRGATLLHIHEILRERILEWTGVPISGYATIASFGMQNLRIAVSPVAVYHEHPWLLATVCTITAAICLVLCCAGEVEPEFDDPGIGRAGDIRRRPLVPAWRNKRLHLLHGILAAVRVRNLDSDPWLMAMLASIIMPSRLAGAFWITAAPAYAIFWSSVRLAFCTGLLYYSGPVLILLLWSIFGVLADLFSLCLFYSLAVFQARSINQRAMPHA